VPVFGLALLFFYGNLINRKFAEDYGNF